MIETSTWFMLVFFLIILTGYQILENLDRPNFNLFMLARYLVPLLMALPVLAYYDII